MIACEQCKRASADRRGSAAELKYMRLIPDDRAKLFFCSGDCYVLFLLRRRMAKKLRLEEDMDPVEREAREREFMEAHYGEIHRDVYTNEAGFRDFLRRNALPNPYAGAPREAAPPDLSDWASLDWADQ